MLDAPNLKEATMARFAHLPSAAPMSAAYSIGRSPQPMRTHQGGAGFAPSDAHAELFNAAVSGTLTDKFFETGGQALERIIALVPQCDPAWLRGFIPWLRATANMRSASVVIAAEYVRTGAPGGRKVVSGALQRADEPGEMLAYWFSRYGREKVPSRLKRGIADAVTRLYNERSMLRWDGGGRPWRFGDVIEMVHPKPSAPWQADLFRHALDRRRHGDAMIPDSLTKIGLTQAIDKVRPEKRSETLPLVVKCEWPWERVAGWLPGGMTAQAWEMLIPTMSYMQLLMNLNNFDRAAISKEAAQGVMARLTDSDGIERSRLFPFRFLTAYRALEADTYKVALSSAAEMAVSNLPEFSGRTLIMVDCSGSMKDPVTGDKSTNPLSCSFAAGFMAEALARRCNDAEIVSYDNNILAVGKPQRHVGLLRAASADRYQARGGTSTWGCTRAVVAEAQFDRVVIITDEQAQDHDDGSIRIPVITWNIAGYRPRQAAHGTGNRYFVAGFSDTALQVLPGMISAGSTGRWPWEVA